MPGYDVDVESKGRKYTLTFGGNTPPTPAEIEEASRQYESTLAPTKPAASPLAGATASASAGANTSRTVKAPQRAVHPPQTGNAFGLVTKPQPTLADTVRKAGGGIPTKNVPPKVSTKLGLIGGGKGLPVNPYDPRIKDPGAVPDKPPVDESLSILRSFQGSFGANDPDSRAMNPGKSDAELINQAQGHMTDKFRQALDDLDSVIPKTPLITAIRQHFDPSANPMVRDMIAGLIPQALAETGMVGADTTPGQKLGAATNLALILGVPLHDVVGPIGKTVLSTLGKAVEGAGSILERGASAAERGIAGKAVKGAEGIGSKIEPRSILEPKPTVEAPVVKQSLTTPTVEPPSQVPDAVKPAEVPPVPEGSGQAPVAAEGVKPKANAIRDQVEEQTQQAHAQRGWDNGDGGKAFGELWRDIHTRAVRIWNRSEYSEPNDIQRVIGFVRGMRDVPYDSGGNIRQYVIGALRERSGMDASSGGLFEHLVGATDKGLVDPQDAIDLLRASNQKDWGGINIENAARDLEKRYNITPKDQNPVQAASIIKPETNPAPTEPTTPKPKESTGLANVVQDAEAEKGTITESPRAQGVKKGTGQAEGKRQVQAGEVNPDTLASEIATGKRTFSNESEVGALMEGKRQKLNDIAAKRKALDNAIKEGGDTSTLAADYEKAQSDLQDYLQKVQAGKGKWSDVGRSLQEGTDLNTGNYDEVLAEYRRVNGGKDVPAKVQKQLQDLTAAHEAATGRITELEKQLADRSAAQAEATVKKQRGARFDKAALDAELDDLLKQGKQILTRVGSGTDKAELLPIAAKVAVNYAKRGINTLEEVVAKVIEHFPTLTRQEVIDAIAEKQHTATRSEIAKNISTLKAEARRSSTGARQKIAGEIADLQNQLKTGEFREAAPKKTPKLEKDIEVARMNRDALKRQINTRVAMAKQTNAAKVLQELNGTSKAIQATGDFSAPLRQGALLGAGNPGAWANAVKEATIAAGSKIHVYRLGKAISEGEMATVYKKMGVHFDNMEGLSPMFQGTSESFPEARITLLPGLKQVHGVSERHYKVFINTLRKNVADSWFQAFPNMSPEELKALGDFINVATGVGYKSAGGTADQILGAAFFSPKMIASRIKAPAMLPYYVYKFGLKSPVTKLAARSWGGFVTAGVVTLISAKMAGAEVSLNPDDPDFGKIKIGDLHFDVWAGFQQPARLLAKVAVGTYQNKFGPPQVYSKGEKEGQPKTPYGSYEMTLDMFRFFRYKSSPNVNTAISLATNEDAVGQKTTELQTIERSLIPLFWQDATDIASSKTNAPWWAKVLALAASAHGVGVSAYRKTKDTEGQESRAGAKN